MTTLKHVVGSLLGPRWRIAEQDHTGTFDVVSRTRCRTIATGLRRDVAEIVAASMNGAKDIARGVVCMNPCARGLARNTTERIHDENSCNHE